jgi:hypothetical protein
LWETPRWNGHSWHTEGWRWYACRRLLTIVLSH